MVTARRLVVVGALVLAVSLAGCSGLTGTDDGADPDDEVDPDDFDAETLQADAIAATGNATTYAFTYDQALTTYSEEGNLTLGVEADGTADETEQLSHLDLTVSFGTEAGSYPVEGEAYHVGDTLYQRGDGNWSGAPAADGHWTLTEQDTALLDGADVEINGTATVDGRETIVLDVEPETGAVATYGLDQELVNDPLREGAAVESVDVTQYVAAESPHRVVRTEIELAVDPNDGEMDGSINASYDYDAEPTFDLPDGVGE